MSTTSERIRRAGQALMQPASERTIDRIVRRRRRRDLVRRIQMSSLAVSVVAILATSFAMLRPLIGQRPEPTPNSAPSHPDAFASLPDGWTTLAPPPEVRAVSAQVWTGSQLIVWGGSVFYGYGNETPEADGFLFDAREDAWRPLAASPLAPSHSPASIWTGREMLIWGGEGPPAGGVPQGAAYDPRTQGWRALPEAPIDRRVPRAIWTGRELILWGSRSREDRRSDGAAYDPSSDRWRTIADAPIELTDATAVWTGAEMIVIGAALHGGNEPETPTAIGAAYDPASDTWRRIPDSELSPQASTAAWDGQEVIAWDYEHRSAAYDPTTDRWRKLEDVPLRSQECSPEAVAIDGAVFGEFCGQMATFDPVTDGWRKLQSPFEAGSWEIIPAGPAVVLLARNLDTGEERALAYRPRAARPSWAAIVLRLTRLIR